VAGGRSGIRLKQATSDFEAKINFIRYLQHLNFVDLNGTALKVTKIVLNNIILQVNPEHQIEMLIN